MISVYTVGKGFFILSIIRRCGIIKEEKLLHVDQIHIEIRIIQVADKRTFPLLPFPVLLSHRLYAPFVRRLSLMVHLFHMSR